MICAAQQREKEGSDCMELKLLTLIPHWAGLPRFCDAPALPTALYHLLQAKQSIETLGPSHGAIRCLALLF